MHTAAPFVSPVVQLHRECGEFRIAVIHHAHNVTVVTKRLLTLLGHEVETANDYGSGLELVRSMHPDIVLCGIDLPHGDGIDLAMEIRRTIPDRPYLIAHTGYSEAYVRSLEREPAFDEVIPMPADLIQFAEAFKRAKLRPHLKADS
jgi:CheY-like chemotaxis protein